MQEKMRVLIDKLNEAADAYYNGKEIMSNYEYDRLFDELAGLEAVSGIIMTDSPTQRAGFRVMDALPKVTHSVPALSLDKTKDITLFPRVFDVRDRKAVVMWKLDGSTVIADYAEGRLVRAATRGNGMIGSDISHNAPYIHGLPAAIPYKGALTVRGEAVMSYAEFDRINRETEQADQYKNPRNLANATISLLDSKEMSRREIWFHAFKLVSSDAEASAQEDCAASLNWLADQGFCVVEHCLTSVDPSSDLPGLTETMESFSARAGGYPFPVDGLVVAANDERYADAQPGTAHNPNRLAGFALKWQDETARTVLREIIWQASRTGLLNPVAVFDPVELEGTTVSRATLHNISYLVDMDLKPGDEISVYKANKIIPKVEKNYSASSEAHAIGDSTFDRYSVPRLCPVCGSPVKLSDDSGSGSFAAYCRNPECAAKKLGRFVHFAERNAMNIIGLSEATIEKLIDWGFVREFADFWKLDRYADRIVEMDGFGERAVEKLLTELEKARKVTFVHFITALGIPNIGPGQAKLLLSHYSNTLEPGSDVVEAFFSQCRSPENSFSQIDGFGEVLNTALHDWGTVNLSENGEVCHLLEQLEITDRLSVLPETDVPRSPIHGKKIVITGSLFHYRNRDALKTRIEELGGKVVGSVTGNTDILICNDENSVSSKHQQAIRLNKTVLTEEAFMALVGDKIPGL